MIDLLPTVFALSGVVIGAVAGHLIGNHAADQQWSTLKGLGALALFWVLFALVAAGLVFLFH